MIDSIKLERHLQAAGMLRRRRRLPFGTVSVSLTTLADAVARPSLGRVLRAALAACVALLCASAAQAQLQVPFPNTIACNAKNLAASKTTNPPLFMDLPGKPGEKGFRAGGPVEDLQGNKIEAWCLEQNADHGGPDLGYLYTPQGKKGVWVGACTLTTGQNLFTIKTDKLIPGANGVPVFNKFTGFTWKNYENDDGKDTVKKDFEYDYDAVNDKLAISRTEGTYKDVKNKNGNTARVLDFKVVETQKDGPIPAPEKFQDLKLNGKSITASAADNQLAKQGMALARAMTERKDLFNFTLSSHATHGTGTDADPFVGIAIQVFGGDTLTIGGTHIHDASVFGDAASSLFGAWVVDSLDDNAITFRATIDTLLDPGTLIDGFSFFADPSHYIPWFYAGGDELANSADIVIPEPTTMMLASLGLALLLLWRRRRPVTRLSSPAR